MCTVYSNLKQIKVAVVLQRFVRMCDIMSFSSYVYAYFFSVGGCICLVCVLFSVCV